MLNHFYYTTNRFYFHLSNEFLKLKVTSYKVTCIIFGLQQKHFSFKHGQANRVPPPKVQGSGLFEHRPALIGTSHSYSGMGSILLNLTAQVRHAHGFLHITITAGGQATFLVPFHGVGS